MENIIYIIADRHIGGVFVVFLVLVSDNVVLVDLNGDFFLLQKSLENVELLSVNRLKVDFSFALALRIYL